MNCEEFKGLVYDYEYDLLEKDEQQNFEQHAQNCYSCQEKLEQSKKGIKLLQYWQPVVKEVSISPVVPLQKSKISPFISAAAVFLLVAVSIAFGVVLKQKEIAWMLVTQENQKKTETIAEYEKRIASLEEVVKDKEHITQLNKEKQIEITDKQPTPAEQKIQDDLKQLATLREKAQLIKDKIPVYRPGSRMRSRLERDLIKTLYREKQLQAQIETKMFAQKMSEKVDNLSPRQTNLNEFAKYNTEKDKAKKEDIEKALDSLFIRRHKLEVIMRYMEHIIQQWEQKYPAQKGLLPYPEETDAILTQANIELAELKEQIADGKKYLKKGEHGEGNLLLSYIRNVPSVLPATKTALKNLQSIIDENERLLNDPDHAKKIAMHKDQRQYEWRKSPGPWYDNVLLHLGILHSLEPQMRKLLDSGGEKCYPLLVEARVSKMKRILDEMGALGIMVHEVEMANGKPIQEIVLAKQKDTPPLLHKKYDLFLQFLETRTLEIDVENFISHLRKSVIDLRTMTENSQTISCNDLRHIHNALRTIRMKFDDSYHEISSALQSLKVK